MKKQTRIILIAICLLTILCVVTFASCKKDKNAITITVDTGLDGQPVQTFTTDKDAEFLSKLAQYVPAQSGLTFAGWFDESGAPITSATRWDRDGAVKARWNADYTTEYYLETDNGFARSDEHTATAQAQLGATVTATEKQIAGYVFDSENSDNVRTATLTANTTLKLYYTRMMCTITFNKNYNQAQGEMESITVPYGTAQAIPELGFTSDLEFGHWSTKANGIGDSYTTGSNITVESDVTLYAQWKISYSEEIYVEELVNGEYTYVLKKSEAGIIGYLGNGVTMQLQFDVPAHYHIDYTLSSDSEPSLYDGAVLTAYYLLDRFMVLYEGGNPISVRYGETHTVIAPEEEDILSYCTARLGNGIEYQFGDEFTVTQDVTLYPVRLYVFDDIAESGDKVEIRMNTHGKGSAVLVKGANRYEGFIVYGEGLITFDVTVNEVELHGKLSDDNKFMYRNEEEVGVFLMLDYLYVDENIYPQYMLSLDGYGIGALSMPADDEEGGMIFFYINYSKTELGDYYMEYYFPGDPNSAGKGYFDIVRTHIDGAEDLKNVVGYFMLMGNEYGDRILLENWEIDSNEYLFLDGYGNGIRYYLSGEEVVEIPGIYLAYGDDFDPDAPEYEFRPLDSSYDQYYRFIFTIYTESHGGEDYYFFIIKHAVFGAFTLTEDAKYPELYLDGFGGAQYKATERDKGTLGTYAIEYTPDGYEVFVKYITDVSTLRVRLNLAARTYTVLDSSFNVDENGVLTEYFGNSSIIVIPEEVDGHTVTAIAQSVFNAITKDLYYTSVTLPATVTSIDDYAFQNSNTLKYVYIAATTPPTLGTAAFGPIDRGNLVIVVPDDCYEQYVAAEGWSNYAKFITTNYMLNHKPLFEVEDGVLLSYNNKDENPSNVSITIPDEVTEIAAHVFANLDYIVSVDLNNVTVIGDSAFDSCASLAAINLNKVVTIGESAFFGCGKLTEVNLDAVRTIGLKAFQYCYRLATVNIGSNIEIIESGAFIECNLNVDDDGNYILDDEGNPLPANKIIVTITATEAPLMGDNIFKGSSALIYVNSYDVGVAYARDLSWKSYATRLRVKSSADTATYYSLANVNATLTLEDYATFYEGTITGLYKWNGSTLTIAWFDYDTYEKVLVADIQTGVYNSNRGEISGFTYDNTALIFAEAGVTLTYSNESNPDEKLTITFGSDKALYNGNSVTIEIVNYRMRFTYQGYIYNLTLTSSQRFSYTKTMIETQKSYTAADGSTLTINLGDVIKANGVLKSIVSGSDIYTETWSWRLTQEDGVTYAWTLMYRSDRFLITATVNDEDNTFTYTFRTYSTQVAYKNGADNVVVTTFTDGHLEMSFSFATAADPLQCNVATVTPVDGQPNAYAVTIAITIVDVDDEGNITERPSDFDGTYTITLDTANLTYTLTKQI